MGGKTVPYIIRVQIVTQNGQLLTNLVLVVGDMLNNVKGDEYNVYLFMQLCNEI